MSETPRNDKDRLTLSAVERQDEICDRFEKAWQAERAPRLEGFLEGTPEAERPALLAELLRVEMVYRQQAGEHPGVEEYRQRLPECITLVDAFFASKTLAPGPNDPALGPDFPTVPGYEVLGELGRGGMGVVYKARQVKADRLVALKMIKSRQADDEDRARLRTEIEAVARLHHSNIVQIYEVGEHNEAPFYSFEFCPGGSLDRLLGGIPRPPEEAAKLVEALARAMQAAHQRQVIHRDLKPANVLLAEDGTPKVTDFGLARKLDDVGQLEVSNAILGTASYMAPEQARGKVREVGPAADTYALGAILYECLTGRPPFKAATLADALYQVIHDEPVAVCQLQPRCPKDLETICLKCLRKELTKRYTSAEELAEDLRRFQADEPIRARPVGLGERAMKWVRRRPAIAGLLLGLVLVAVLGFAGVTGALLYALEGWGEADGQRLRADGERDVAVEKENLAQKAKLTADKAREDANRDKAEALKQKRAANEAREEVGKKAEALVEEQKETKKQLTRAEWLLYDSQIQAAQREWEAGNVAAAWEHLDACRWDYRGLEHRYLCNLFNHNQVTLKGHTRPVNSVAMSSDGKRIVSGSFDKTVKVWDATTGKELLSLKGHTNTVWSVAISRDGKRIVSGSSDKTVKVWDAATRQEKLSLKGHTKEVMSVAISPDGKRIVSGSSDKTVKVWDATTGKNPHTLKAHTDAVVSVAISPDGKRIVSGSSDKTVKVWDATTGKALSTLIGHTHNVTSVAISPDGNRIVSGSWDKTVKVWDANTGKNLLSLIGHTHNVTSVLFSADGGRIVSGSDDNTVKVWKARTGKDILSLKGHSHWVKSVAASVDGGRIVSGSGDNTVKVWDARMGKDLHTLEGHSQGVSSVAVSVDGGRIVSGGYYDKTVKVWDARTGKSLLSLIGHTRGVSSVAVSGDGKRIVSGSLDKTVKVWDANTGKNLHTLKGHTAPVTSVAISADGKRIVSGSVDETVRVWDVHISKNTLPMPSSKLSWSWLPRLWDGTSKNTIPPLKGHTSWVSSVAVSADGRSIVSGSFDNTVKVWDASTGKHLRTLTGHAFMVTRVALPVDGKRILSSSYDKTVKVWDLTTGKNLLSLIGHADWVNCVAVSADGGRIISGSNDKTVRVWDANTGKNLLSLIGHTKSIESVAVSVDGGRIVSGSGDNTVRVWDATAGKDLLTLKGQTGIVTSVAVSVDGKRVFGQDRNGRTSAWDASSGQLLPDPPARIPAGRREATSADGRLRLRIDLGVIQVSRPDIADAYKRRTAADRKLLEHLARFDPNWHRNQLSDALRGGDDFAAAFHLERLVRGQPWDAALHVHYAHVLARLGNREKSATHLMHALFLRPRVSLWPLDPTATRRGEEAAQAGNWPRAVQAFLVAAHQPQAPATSLTDLLLAQIAASDTAGAQQTMEVLTQRLANEKNLRVAGHIFFVSMAVPWDKPRVAPLLAHARRRLDKQRNADTLDDYGVALYRAGRHAEAAKTLADSVKADNKGGFIHTWLFQALAARQQGKDDDAIRLLARVEAWHRTQTISSWKSRVWWNALLAEARKLIHTPPPMPKVAPGD